jgi:hypothetical protein
MDRLLTTATISGSGFLPVAVGDLAVEGVGPKDPAATHGGAWTTGTAASSCTWALAEALPQQYRKTAHTPSTHRPPRIIPNRALRNPFRVIAVPP